MCKENHMKHVVVLTKKSEQPSSQIQAKTNIVDQFSLLLFLALLVW